MKKILVTGGSGMVGRNLLSHKESEKFDIIAPSHGVLDLTIKRDVDEYLADEMPDFIIHCAGLVGGIQANLKYPLEFLMENLDMGCNLLMSARKVGIKNVLALGSNCMYPKNIEEGLTEEMILKGELEESNEGYALAKITISKLCKIISNENKDYNYKMIVPCSLYGKWDKFSPESSHLIPAIIKKLNDARVNNEVNVEIWGDGLARREIMYAEDLADFIYFSLDRFNELPEIMNVGLGKDYSINELYSAVAKVVGYKGGFFHNLDRPVGMRKKLLNIKQLESFGWQSGTSLEQGLKLTNDFYLSNI
ncbi:NAD-dependent epimerase/dehydratase family protein [Halobacteriovorax sp. HLS]|uniref:NAD-dependent epimerase/dehydratase family protein n=1 Tax=Halobacteriovorax sp. HLS TaxID=2234000 RepID=UPI000FD92264|nr:NAD-dependent epimerase/dehydratase family protein [Halobacteriovorax sp. HLS]